MRLVPAEAQAIRYVAENMRDRDFEELISLTSLSTRSELADLMVANHDGREGVFAAWADDGIPVAVGGAVEVRPSVLGLLFFCTDRARSELSGLTPAITKTLSARMQSGDIRRIECTTLGENKMIHTWLRRLGLRKEAELLEFGRDGQTYHMYARTRHADPTGAGE